MVPLLTDTAVASERVVSPRRRIKREIFSENCTILNRTLDCSEAFSFVYCSNMISAPDKVERKAPIAIRGRFPGAAAVGRELGLSTSHVWRVLAGERANIGTADRILAAHSRWLRRACRSAA